MNDAARRLRAQKAYSTDPDYLERMARAEEARSAEPPQKAPAKRRRLALRVQPEGVTAAGRWKSVRF